jgi:hypothetical protein
MRLRLSGGREALDSFRLMAGLGDVAPPLFLLLLIGCCEFQFVAQERFELRLPSKGMQLPVSLMSCWLRREASPGAVAVIDVMSVPGPRQHVPRVREDVTGAYKLLSTKCSVASGRLSARVCKDMATRQSTLVRDTDLQASRKTRALSAWCAAAVYSSTVILSLV